MAKMARQERHGQKEREMEREQERERVGIRKCLRNVQQLNRNEERELLTSHL